jgi:hypothetical protein
VRVRPFERVFGGLATRSPQGGKAEDHSPDPRLLAFARGLAAGALIGAAIAGSSIWRRGRRGNERSLDESGRPD